MPNHETCKNLSFDQYEMVTQSQFYNRVVLGVSYVVHSKSQCIPSGTDSGRLHRSRRSYTSHYIVEL